MFHAFKHYVWFESMQQRMEACTAAPLYMWRKMVVVVMLLLLVGGCWREVNGLVKLPPNLKIPAVFVLGDSVMDTGNNNDLVSLAKCNYLPYGKDFKGGVATGRCCNGKVPSDLIGIYLYVSHLANFIS